MPSTGRGRGQCQPKQRGRKTSPPRMGRRVAHGMLALLNPLQPSVVLGLVGCYCGFFGALSDPRLCLAFRFVSSALAHFGYAFCLPLPFFVTMLSLFASGGDEHPSPDAHPLVSLQSTAAGPGIRERRDFLMTSKKITGSVSCLLTPMSVERELHLKRNSAQVSEFADHSKRGLTLPRPLPTNTSSSTPPTHSPLAPPPPPLPPTHHST